MFSGIGQRWAVYRDLARLRRGCLRWAVYGSLARFRVGPGGGRVPALHRGLGERAVRPGDAGRARSIIHPDVLAGGFSRLRPPPIGPSPPGGWSERLPSLAQPCPVAMEATQRRGVGNVTFHHGISRKSARDCRISRTRPRGRAVQEPRGSDAVARELEEVTRRTRGQPG